MRPFLLLVLIAAFPADALARSRSLPVFEVGISDYPADWRSNPRIGLVLLQFEVLPNTRIGACRVLRSSVPREMKEASCRLLIERARFAPERDRAGRPRASRHNAYFNWRGSTSDFGGAIPVNHINWLQSGDYPRGGVARGVAGRVVLTYDITVDGRLENCQVVESSGFAELDQAACHAYTQRGRFLPARDPSGEPRRTRGRTSIRFRIREN